MNKLLFIPIIIGGSAIIAGSIIFGFAIASQGKNKLEDKTFELDGEVSNFDINISIADLEFKVGDSAKVVCHESEKEHHEVTLKDGTLSIKFVDEKEWYEKIFNWSLDQFKVTVYVPAGEYGNLKIKAATGDITVPHDFSFADLNAKVSTGDYDIRSNVTNKIDVESSTGMVHLGELTTKEMNVKCSTGRINILKCTVAEKITTNSSTGTQKITETTCQNLDMKASTGDIVLTRTIVEKHIKIKTSTGNVQFYGSDAESLNIKTDTGDVRGNLLTNKLFKAHSDTGRVKVPEYHVGDEVTGECVIDTDTGNIEMTVGND